MTKEKEAMLRLPQFSIAQIMGFTFVIALNVWAFVWDFSLGFWTTFLTQFLYWTLLRINAALRLEPELKTVGMTLQRLDWTITKLVVTSALCTLAGTVAFCTVCTATAFPVGVNEMGIDGPSTNRFLYVLFGMSIPLGILAAAAWLWWTWPRK